MKLYNSENLRKVDEETHLLFNYPEDILMENAGRGFFERLKRYYPEHPSVLNVKTGSKKCRSGKSFTVVCGKGNNGGDGFVISRYLFNEGYTVKTVILAKRELYKDIALQNLNILLKLGAYVVEINENNLNNFQEILSETDVLIDAIFGVGLNRNITGFFEEIINMINSNALKAKYDIFCVDVPSGLNSDNGNIMGCCINNGLKGVYTFGGNKVGFYVDGGERLILNKKTKVVDINHPKELLEKHHANIELIDNDLISSIYPERNAISTKFGFGHMLAVAGSPGKTGAAYMCSLAGLRGGAGLVTSIIPAKLNDIMEVKTTEVMTFPVPDRNKGYFTMESFEFLEKSRIFNGKTSVVIGPGLGLEDETKEFFYSLLRFINKTTNIPVIIDADGLNILSENIKILDDLRYSVNGEYSKIILTPHYKEMERLTGISRHIIERDPIKIGRDFAGKYGVFLALKGSSMYLFHSNGVDSAIQPEHSSLLASGGSGDVLSGLMASFSSQSVPVFDAMEISSFLIVKSAISLSMEGKGDFGLGASAIAENIPLTVKKIIN